MAKLKFQTPTGMHDILPEDQAYLRSIMKVAESVSAFYGFQRIDTPILENAELYEKGTGVSTDIVEKQMYTLKTRGGDLLALRPEFTPNIVRSFLQHGMYNLPQPVKLYTSGPLFRYERPQEGRYRQLHQFDVEVFGDQSAAIDAQLIQMFVAILKDLKLSHIIVEVNSIGDSQCRPYYKKALISYLKNKQYAVCTDCRRRIKTNPLRVLDCKEEKCQQIRSQAPQMIDYLCQECKDHFKSLLEFLDEADLPYHLDPYLVRGLDYYTKTVFEVFAERSPGNPDEKGFLALGGGGRYDGLMKLYGGRETPAAGFGMGIDRVLSAVKRQSLPSEPSSPKIFLAQLGDQAKKKSMKLFEEFRKANISVAESLGRDSLRAQLARADKLGVSHTLILGQREVLDNSIVIRTMGSGAQKTVKLNEAVEEVKKLIRGK
ncbi:MAG: histidine--tRNA ligase [bacterium]|nr:histidine--tRNA ligase [bacterium]